MILAHRPLTRSTRLKPLPPVEPGYAVEITPTRYNSMDEVFAANPNGLDYCMRPGEYRGWPAGFSMPQGGTLERPRTLRYSHDDEGVHPVNRRNEAVIHPLKFSHVAHWMLSGLTVRDSTSQFVVQGSNGHHIVFDRLLTEGMRTYTIRITRSFCTVQNSVMRNGFKNLSGPKADFLPIQFKPVDGDPIVDPHVLDCELYNQRDCAGITQDGIYPSTAVRGAVFEGCDMYNTPAYRGWTENALDMKVGDAIARILIKNNRMWGHWPGGQGAGDVIVVHQLCRNVDVVGNILGEGIAGIRDEVFVGADPEYVTRGITFLGNYCYSLEGGGPRASGIVDLIHSSLVAGNYFVNSGHLLGSVPRAGYKGGGPTFIDNFRLGVPSKRALIGTDADSIAIPYDDNRNRFVPAAGDFTYERKRWTGPEICLVRKGSPSEGVVWPVP